MSAPKFSPELVAPCGMNCSICKAYLALSRNVPRKKGAVTHCAGCRVRDKNCAFIKRDCEKIRKKQILFCYQCPDMPCERLTKLDTYYRSRYSMSMIENQKLMKEKGMTAFLKDQIEKYQCPKCGDVVSVHDSKCYACGYKGEKPHGSIPKHSWIPNRKKDSK